MRPWLPVCALLALGCASNPPRVDAGTDAPAPFDAEADATPPEDRPAALDVVAVDTPDVNQTEIAPTVDVVDAGGGEDAPDAVAVADVPALDAPDAVTADTPDVAVAVVDAVDARPVCDAMLDSDYTNCGACGVVCGDRPNAVGVCRAGVCGTSCRSNFADCDGDPSNGCETSIVNNAANCGMCGRACGTGQQCSFTTCACQLGGTLCGDRCVLTQSDPNNCGACGVACRSPNGTPTCTAGRCGVVCSLSDRRGNCDGDPSNGCEADFRVDPNNCGACGAACAVPNAMAACIGGACGIGACASSFADCDGDASNGCETDTATTYAHCGGCGLGATLPECRTPPGARGTCTDGRCGWVCLQSRGDCDSNSNNGCEVNLMTNAMHCGACGRACLLANALASCSASQCRVLACDPTYVNCDGQDANGCEAATQTDRNNCGLCGRRCPTGSACIDGTCR